MAERAPKASLDLMGLVRALRHTFESNGNVKTPCHVFSDDSLRRLRFPDDVEIAFYRFAQEAIGNAIRHSDASEIEIKIVYEDQTLCMSITDDGKGFDYEDIAKHGIGMNSMKSRIEGIGGILTIESQAGLTRLFARAKCQPVCV